MKQAQNEAVERLDADRSSDRLQVFLHKQRYDFALDRLRKEDKVLEIGTGAGVFSQTLATYCREYAGIEFDSEACETTRNRLQGTCGQVIRGDAQSLPFADRSFSAMVCLEVLEHLPDFRKAVKEMHRCLEPGGRIIISVPHRKRGGKNPLNTFHLYEPGESELRAEFLKYFLQVQPRYQYFEETTMMTLARILGLRGILGLTSAYSGLTDGTPSALEKIKIGERSGGLNIILLLEISERRETLR